MMRATKESIEMNKLVASVLLTIATATLTLGAGSTLPTVTRTTTGTGTPVTVQNSSAPLYTLKNGHSIVGQSTTIVTGGSSVNGSGGIIQNGTRGSQSSTSYGVGYSIPLGGTKKK
jgi:hypothetical protein